MALRDQPYLPLYIKDIMTDEKLVLCSAASHGVYLRLLCILHKQETYGLLPLKQKYKQTESKFINFASLLVTQMPFKQEVIEAGLRDLSDEDVIQMTDDTLGQKRMLRDGALSLVRAEAGSKGGKSLKIKDNDTDKQTVKQKRSKSVSKNTSKSEANTANAIGIGIDNNTKKGVLPEWVPKERFELYNKSRNKKIKPASMELFLDKLQKLAKESSCSPDDILKQSIEMGWEGIFPLKSDKPKNQGRAPIESSPYEICNRCGAEVRKEDFTTISGKRCCIKCPEFKTRDSAEVARVHEMIAGIGKKMS